VLFAIGLKEMYVGFTMAGPPPAQHPGSANRPRTGPDARTAMDANAPATRPDLPAQHRTGQHSTGQRGGGGPLDVPGGRPHRRFESAVLAFRCGDYLQAEALFVEDARACLTDQPQRAAIAFRQASLAARAAGNRAAADHWMLLAGQEYLRAGQDPAAPATRIREASIMAARCFLTVGDLGLARLAVRRIQALQEPLTVVDRLLRGGASARFPVAMLPLHRDRAGRAGSAWNGQAG
jgi:hypothetical protein